LFPDVLNRTLTSIFDMRKLMKPYTKLLLLLFFFIISQCEIAQAFIQLTYTIEVNVDGSAAWIIEQKGIGIPTPIFDAFVKNVSLLISVAAEKTQRNMTAESLSMSVNVSGSYKIIRYYFIWKEFAKTENGQITIGDVFQVENFFSYLYGDGAVIASYPSEYAIEIVSPPPHERDDSINRLEWYGTVDFKEGEPKVVFAKKSAFGNFMDIISKNAILIVSLAALTSGGFIGVYYFKFKRKMIKKRVDTELSLQGIRKIEDDEEKVINLLRSAGGSLYQSAIADSCGFSRAKASKLLKRMEDEGRIRREDKGREKIVTLLEEAKG
jgi:uncharacterized membrane protein